MEMNQKTNMEAQILKLDAPYDYIYCNGEVGKHVGTYIVGESSKDADGNYTLETHSHPIVQYKNSAKGVVWNRAEIADCEVLCNEADMRVDVRTFFLLCVQQTERKEEAAGNEYCYSWDGLPEEAEALRAKLREYGIGFKSKTGIETVGVEVGGCGQGYFAQMIDISIVYFHHIEPSLEELGKRLTEEHEYWEDFYDHVVKIKYTPESSTAKGFVENL